MTPEPPSPSEGSSLPPRSRPNLGDLLKDSQESDLWAFDDLDPPDEAAVEISSRPKPSIIPVPRGLPSKQAPGIKDLSPSKEEEDKDSSRLNVVRGPVKSKNRSIPEAEKKASDIDDLEDWDDMGNESPNLEIHPSLIGHSTLEGGSQGPEEKDVVSKELPQKDLVTGSSKVAEIDKVSSADREKIASTSLAPRLALSKIEWLGLGALLVILLVGGVLIFVNVSNRLPTNSGRTVMGDFPVKGVHTQIVTAETFWRVPIVDGENADTFRRGTQLLPVIELTAEGTPAAVRVFFRDQDGVVVGDAVTRTIRPGVPLQVAATTGFDDVGMHAAYRTGQGKPWTVEVREAATATSSNADFKRLFEVDVSTDRR